MDTTKARAHAQQSQTQLLEKASASGFDVKNTASYHTNVAILALCDALDESNRMKPADALAYGEETKRQLAAALTNPVSPGVFSTPEYEKHTSPYRHYREAEQQHYEMAISARELNKDVD